jgi:prepilin-type N-terminal cleavage/methylation domain-containing protein
MRREQGFTLLEVLIVLVVLGILVTIGVPSYLGQKTKTENAAAAANVKQAVTPVRTYYLDNGTFVGMTVAKLRKTYDRGFPKKVAVVSVGADWYCIRSKVGKSTWYKARRGEITTTRCK